MAEYYKHLNWPSEEGESFQRAQTLSSTPGQNGWAITDTSSGGTPTYVTNNGGGLTITLDNTSEAQTVALYQADKLIWDIDELQSISFFAKVSGVDSVTTICMGLASAHNATADSIAANAWFRMQGSASTSAVVVESDDGTTDNDDKATGATLSSTLKKFTIDLTNGKSDVRFYIDDTRVATTTTFDISGYSSGVQPYFLLAKASGTGTPALTIRHIDPVKLSSPLT